MSIREATHAGSWYPGSKSALKAKLQSFLDAANATSSKAKAIIVPHAGISYCGLTEAHAFKYFDTSAKRVFIIGPSHHYGFRGCALSKYETWKTPLGNLSVDTDVIKDLSSNSKVKWTKIPHYAEDEEHSLEMCTTWIALLAPNIKIVPIMVSFVNFEATKDYAEALLPFFQDNESAFVISSDFCHWGSDFDYTYTNKEWYSDNNIYKSIEKLDSLAMESISTLNPMNYKEYSSQYKNTICGKKAIYIAMHGFDLMKSDYKCKFVHYSQSNKVTDKNDFSVSYAAGVFYK